MRTKPITPNLIQLTRLSFVNAYLVREDDGFTLIDTTMGGKAAQDLIGAAEKAGGEIRRIALTHGHGDHAGGLDAIVKRLGGGIEVLVGEPDARVWAGAKEIDGEKVTGMWKDVETKPDVLLHGGERIGSLEVVASPGHTAGHVAFLDTRERSLIAGDVFTSYGRPEVSNHFYWRFPLAFGATADSARDLASARTLSALDPSRLAVGHGPVTEAPRAAIDAAIARSAKSLGEPA